ncbi:sodium-dependent transporter [Lysinibacillus piscis]|uniref:Transporter n=1 Tax=Lysinibacillus piscis TaxID=2518931 RepID=A0ABQ5NNB1_9BACI|nr:sodium-dependent transporter [Lysinibacillus sp. KH24]GLC89789.1 transporter [Lysinibacillus sp. KH24]
MENKEQWSSKIGFILASAGAAIGLGAIWKFPYVVGQSGGGAFFLLFVLFTVLIGLPMLIAEYVIGRKAEKEAVSAYHKLAPSSWMKQTGLLGVIGCVLLLSFYAVVGGWIIVYTLLGAINQIIGGNRSYDELFGYVISTPWITLAGLFVFILLNVFVIAAGVQKGIEKASKVLMPLLFIFFIILVVRSLTLDNAMEGVKFFLAPDFSNITWEAVLFALGQSFFSLAVGFSCMVTYSSYLSKKESLPNAAGTVVVLNILVSLLAGLAIFPAVFSFGIEPTAGPGLLFNVLPTVFAQIPFGSVFLFLFLLLFLFATITSSFSMFEIIVSAVVENRGTNRKVTTYGAGVVMFILAIPAALSFGVLGDVSFFGKGIFDATDYLVSNILLPIGALIIAIFIRWSVPKETIRVEFLQGSKLGDGMFGVWYGLMTYLVPIVIILVFILSL